MSNSCFIDRCSAYKQTNTSFHRFPKNEELCKNWCESIKTLNKQENAFSFHRNSFVCGHHFETRHKYVSGKKTRLYKAAVPTIYQNSGETEQVLESVLDEPVECEIEPEECEIEPQDFESEHQDFESEHQDFENEQQEFQNEPVVVIEEGATNYIVDERSMGASDQEDFFGFNKADLNSAKKIEAESRTDPSDDNDDEIIFVENKVEVIEIDDDDNDNDIEIPPTVRIEPPEKPLSRYDIQRMVLANDPQVQLVKPKLDWKSDQFRLVQINGKYQNCCTCTKCWELFDEINIDNVVKHAKCNPSPSVAPGVKRKRLIDYYQENIAGQELDIFGASFQHLTTSNIRTIAGCMDVQPSSFYHREKFLQFAQFMIDTGAKFANPNKQKFVYEPKTEALGSFRDQLKDVQSSKIMSILTDTTVDFSLSCEVWEDISRCKTNVSLELHYLDENFVGHRMVIGVRSISGIGIIEDVTICGRILDILNVYASERNAADFLQRATAFVTSRRLDTGSLETTYFPSAGSVINEVANGIINDDRLKIAEKSLHVIGWLNGVCTEKITEFDAKKWENVFDIFKKFTDKKASFAQQTVDTNIPYDTSTLQLLQPFHDAIVQLTGAENSITKVFGIWTKLERSLMPLDSDGRIVKLVKRKAVSILKTAFAESDTYQICMFLDPSNRDQYDSLQSDGMDSLQSKIDLMITAYMATKANGCMDNDLIGYMDDNVTSNQIDVFLQLSVTSRQQNLYEFWRDNNKQMPGLRALARKYLSVPTYASRSECKFSQDAAEFLAKRSKLEVKDMETMLMMNSSQVDVDLLNVK